jgi:hypothetical protein
VCSSPEVRAYFLKWKNLTQEILDELAAARKELSHAGRPETGTNVPIKT